MNNVYHVLGETEPFSAFRGGAIAHTVANLLRLWPERVAVCPFADDTWGYSPDRILVIEPLQKYQKIKGRRFLPLFIVLPFLRKALQPLIDRLQAHDVVWFHNQPIFQMAIEDQIRAKGAYIVQQFHDPDNFHDRQKALKVIRPDAVVFVSKFLEDYWLNLYPNLANARTIYNAYDSALFYPPSPDEDEARVPPVVLYVGRLRPEKGVHVLIEAMNLLAERKVSAECKIVGSAFSGAAVVRGYEKRLRRSSGSNVSYVGFLSAKKIADAFRSGDVFCCPSLWQEAFGKVNIEAMACGLPVIASKVGGIPEIGAEGGMILVQPGSAVELADAIQKLVEDESLRKEISAAGLTAVRRRFTWEIVDKQYREVVEKLRVSSAALPGGRA